MCLRSLWKKYCSVASMCNAYHVNPNDYRTSIRAGESVETALLENVRKDFARKDYVFDHHGNQYPNTRAMTDVLLILLGEMVM